MSPNGSVDTRSLSLRHNKNPAELRCKSIYLRHTGRSRVVLISLKTSRGSHFGEQFGRPPSVSQVIRVRGQGSCSTRLPFPLFLHHPPRRPRPSRSPDAASALPPRCGLHPLTSYSPLDRLQAPPRTQLSCRRRCAKNQALGFAEELRRAVDPSVRMHATLLTTTAARARRRLTSAVHPSWRTLAPLPHNEPRRVHSTEAARRCHVGLKIALSGLFRSISVRVFVFFRHFFAFF